MAIVERASELARLQHLLDEAVRGAGCAITVRGIVGSGKTALLHDFAARAGEQGVTVLSAGASLAERSLPLEVLNQVFTYAPPPYDARTHAVQVLLDRGLAAARSDARGDVIEQARIMRELWLAVYAMSQRNPLLICIDDVQHADEASMRYLLYFVRRLMGARIQLVFTEWDHLSRIHPLTDLDLLRQHHCHRMRLRPLSPEGIAAMLDDRLPDLADGEVAAWIHHVSGGNPLLAGALIEDCRGLQRRQAPVAGEAYQMAVLTCLHRGGTAGLRLAQATAVLGEAESDLVLQLTGIESVSVRHSIDVLNATGVLESGRFRDPAARHAVLSDLGREERLSLEDQAARILYAQGAPKAVVAGHLIAAGHAGAPWGGEVLMEAAEEAMLRDDPDAALRCLRLAARECGDDKRRAAITMMLVRAEWRRNPAAVDRHASALVAALHRGNLGSHDAHTVVRSMFWQGQFGHALNLLPQLGLIAGGDPAEATERRITEHWLSCFFPPLAGARSAEDGEVSPANAGELQAVAALATVLTAGPRHSAAGTAGAGSAAEQYLQSARLDDTTLQAVESALLALMYVDCERAAFWCDNAIEEATARRAPAWRAVLMAIRAEIAVHQGDLPTARRCAATALTDLPRQSWGVALGTPVSSLVLAATRMGAHDVAAAEVRRPVPDSIFQTRFGLQFLDARGHHYLATGRAHAAASDFLLCGELMTRWGVDLPTYPQWRLGAAAAALASGDPAQAAELVKAQLSGPGSESPGVRGASLRMQALVSRPHYRPALLREAVALLQMCGDRFELALALADLSRTHAELGELSRAHLFRNRAVSLARAGGMAPLLASLEATQVDAEAAVRAGDGPEGAGFGLSDAEYRVASLAAVGYMNREIAKELCITVSTVEQHLTRAYRKLEVPGRSGLPDRLLGAGHRRQVPSGSWAGGGADRPVQGA